MSEFVPTLQLRYSTKMEPNFQKRRVSNISYNEHSQFGFHVRENMSLSSKTTIRLFPVSRFYHALLLEWMLLLKKKEKSRKRWKNELTLWSQLRMRLGSHTVKAITTSKSSTFISFIMRTKRCEERKLKNSAFISSLITTKKFLEGFSVQFY